jgi:hypothetical protein
MHIRAISKEKFELTSQNPSINNQLFIEIIRLFLDFLLEIENFSENRSVISLKFFISTDFFQFQLVHL